jgi:hypothetical protein
MKMNNYVLMNEEPADTGGGEPANIGQSSDGNWYDSLPEDMREDQNITKFDSVESLGKSWLNAQRLIGADKIPMPQTDDDWENTYNRLGRPEDVAGYEVKAPEGVEIDSELQGSFLQTAHSLGLNQKQVEGLANWQFEQGANTQQASQQQSEQAFNEAMNGLKSEWGNAFEQNANVAVRAASEFLSDDDKAFIENAKIDGIEVGNHPMFLKLFHNVGKQMMEGSKLEGLGSEAIKTPDEMEDERNSLMANPAYMDSRHPEHKQIVKKVQNLFQQQFGS